MKILNIVVITSSLLLTGCGQGFIPSQPTQPSASQDIGNRAGMMDSTLTPSTGSSTTGMTPSTPTLGTGSSSSQAPFSEPTPVPPSTSSAVPGEATFSSPNTNDQFNSNSTRPQQTTEAIDHMTEQLTDDDNPSQNKNFSPNQ